MFKKTVLMALMSFLVYGNAFAAHPLITDDAGTQGAGKYQFELNYEYDHDDSDGVVTKENLIQTAMTCGVMDTMDVVVTLPYQFLSTESGGTTVSENGISDTAIDVKWRFFEKEGLALALKPGIKLPTGDDQRGLGSGRMGYQMYFIATQEMKPLTFHFNLGYMRNENSDVVDERKDLWHVSLASEMPLASWVKAVMNVGIEKNPDKNSETDPAFILGGLIFPVTEYLDLDVGVKGGLTSTENDYSLLTGLTLRF